MATLDTLVKKNAANAAPVMSTVAPKPATPQPTQLVIPGNGSQPLQPAQPMQRGIGGSPLTPAQITATTVQNPFPTSTSTQGSTTQGTYQPVGDESTIMQSYLSQLMNADNALMRNARTRGIETAATAGLQNSSIAAGAAERAALETVVPLAQQAYGLFGDRENRNWQTNEQNRQRDWQTVEENRQREWTSQQNRLDRDQQLTMAQVQNWLNNETFTREFNANLALMPITNTTQLLNALMDNAMQNPEVYTPDIISGMSEFFTTNFLSVLSRYFPSMYTTTGGKR